MIKVSNVNNNEMLNTILFLVAFAKFLTSSFYLPIVFWLTKRLSVGLRFNDIYEIIKIYY